MSTKAAQVDERREKERRRKIADAYLRQMAFQAATLLGAGTGSAGIFNEYWKKARTDEKYLRLKEEFKNAIIEMES